MPHPKQHIRDLAEICKRRNINRIIISPGSRSAPLIETFYTAFGEDCISIVDERSAAYFGLGIAVFTKQPVALICTSGTAVLNYGPALAEAYYQQIPLLAITADRPHEWIDQQDNQTLRQRNIYRNFIKGSFELPQFTVTDDDLWFTHRMVNDAVNLCTGYPRGPVHINVPMTEPLYDEIPPASENIKLIRREVSEINVSLPRELISEWKNARRIMIVHGQDLPDPGMTDALQAFSNDPRVIVIAENIANIQTSDIITGSNFALSASRANSPDFPDLLLHSGGQVVSKSLTGYLRRGKGISCWRIGSDPFIIDTFRQAGHLLPYHAKDIYSALSKYVSKGKTGYKERWLSMAAAASNLAAERISQLPFSDVHVFSKVMTAIPDETLVALGNSSVIRYSQLFPVNIKNFYYSNRGISGIDGCISTAAGIACASKKPTVAITGDLGLIYDSNGLWNKELPSNLKIVVVNNQGGGIFHIIKGPAEHPGFKKFIEAYHPVNISKLAEAYGLHYFSAEDEKSLAEKWIDFIKPQAVPAILEVKTNAVTSASAFRKLMMSS